MEAIICIMVLVAWSLMLLGWFEFFGEVFKKEFNLRDTLIAFGILTILSIYILWLGIQSLS